MQDKTNNENLTPENHDDNGEAKSNIDNQNKNENKENHLIDHDDDQDGFTNSHLSDDENNNMLSKDKRLVRLSFIIGLLAIAGVIYLIANQSKSGDTYTPSQSMVNEGKGSDAGTRIAFVRADSVQNNYLMTIYFLDSIEARFRSLEGDLISKQQAYERKIRNYYNDVQSGLLRESAALQIKEKLEQEGENIARLEESYSNRINELQLQLNIIYFDSLWNFLERNKNILGYDMVVGYQKGLTNILFSDDRLDITEQVIEMMNKEYIERYPKRKDIKRRIR